MVESSRIRIISNSDYGIDLEYSEDLVIVHFPYCNKFTKNTYLSMLIDLDRFTHFLKTAGYEKLYASVYHDDLKVKKLLKKLLFTRFSISDDMDIFERKN